MNYIDLFSGIGGFALGAYWADMHFDKHYFSEVEPYAVELYRKRFPDAIPLGDITKVKWETLDDSIGRRWRDSEDTEVSRQRLSNTSIDSSKNEYIITGGFPCQDISVAGKGKGIEGSRSGLWSEMFKSIRILRPRFTVIENVGAITFRGLDRVLADLAEIGYDAEWQDIRASDMGASHRRERIWIVAYPDSYRKNELTSRIQSTSSKFVRSNIDIICKDVADTEGFYAQRQQGGQGQGQFRRSCGWESEPSVGMLVNGLPSGLERFEGRLSSKSYKRVDQLKGLGNAIVPQIAELLFRQIKTVMEESEESTDRG